jgi:hypothetical protein
MATEVKLRDVDYNVSIVEVVEPSKKMSNRKRSVIRGYTDTKEIGELIRNLAKNGEVRLVSGKSHFFTQTAEERYRRVYEELLQYTK